MPAGKHLNKAFCLRLSDELLERIKKKAEKEGKTATEFIKQIIMKNLEEKK